MMNTHKQKKTFIAIIPVGPGTNINFLVDTIESIKFYCSKNHAIILANDSQKPLPSVLNKYTIDEVVLETRMGKEAGLYFTLCKCINYALNSYDFDVILRLDDDAIITGKMPEKDAINYFRSHRDIGMLGSYRSNWLNEPRSFEDPKRIILRESSHLAKMMRRIFGRNSPDYENILSEACDQGYELGEHVLGGAYFMSKKFILKLKGQDLLPAKEMRRSKLQEDHIFGLLSGAIKMKLGDFVTGSYPMCLKLKGMPTSVAEVIMLNKKVVHSTRYYKDLREDEIRKQFRKYRK